MNTTPFLHAFTPTKVFLLSLILFSSLSLLVSPFNTDSNEPLPSTHSHNHNHNHPFGRRGILQVQEDDDDELVAEKPKPIKKKPTSSSSSYTTTISTSNPTSSSLSTKNKTKLIKPISSNSAKNSTKLIKPKPTSDSTQSQTKILNLTSISTKNKTKLTKPTTENSIKQTPIIKNKLTNSTKPNSLLTKKTSDLPKNKTTKPITSIQKAQSQTQTKKNQLTSPVLKKPNPNKKLPKQEDDEDLVAEFRDLPSRFQETLLPDLDIISTTSKVYLNRANNEITKGFKPIVGKKYAPIIASIVSFAFILIPLILVSLIFNRIKAYFSLQKLLIFIQIYLSIYFSILSLSSIVTGLEPLKFFYATSQSTYVCIQLLQTLAYVLYLLMLLMYMILVFSTDSAMTSKILGLAQTFVGFAVGLHYYMTVFHRAVLHQPPKTSWKVHAIYATCFLLICLLARAERRKKAYLVEGGEEGKTS